MFTSQAPKSNCIRVSILLALAVTLLVISVTVPHRAVKAQGCGVITDKLPHPEPAPPSLPTWGGTFVDPTFCTTIMRVTDASDGILCNNYYSYWPSFNLDSTRFFISCDNNPRLYSFDPNGFQIIGKGPLYASQLPGGGFMSTEDAIWSGTNPNLLYGYNGRKLWAYDVSAGTYAQIKDFTSIGAASYLGQMSRSLDDNIFAFSLKDSNYAAIGYLVWRRDTDTVLRMIFLADLDEVEIDKTGRYLVVKADFGGAVDFQVVDLQTSNVENLTDPAPDFSPGHSDNGRNIVVGHDNWNNQYTVRSLATPHQFSTVIGFGNDWSQGNHLSMLADNESWGLISNFTASTPTTPEAPFRQEIFQASTDGTQSVRRLAHHHSVYGNEYWNTPRANISRDGRFVAFTSNWGSATRRDVFIIKVPLSCTYSISPASQSIGAGGGAGSISVTAASGCNWTAASNNSWITITSGTPGAGNGTVAYSVAANTGAARSGTITAASQTFTVNQAASASGPQNVVWTNVVNCTVTGNSLQKTGGCDGCTDAGAWSQQSIASGNGYLEFTATETNKIRFGALTATRSTSDYTLLDFSLEFNGGGYAEVRENFAYKTDTSFTSGTVFRIAVESGVVKYYKNGTVFYTSTKTPSFPLYADAVMTNANATITNAIILTSSCQYAIAPTSQSVSSGASNGTISVTTTIGCNWTAVSNSPWITITSGAGGTGNGTVAYSVAVNPNGTTRSGTITAAGQTFTVNQAAAPCNYSISPSSQSFTSGAGTGSITLTATGGCDWTAASNVSWITITSGASGTGNGTVAYSVAANSTGMPRSGTITAATQTFTVNQAAACSYSISPASQSFSAGAGAGSIILTATMGCNWTAASNNSWITITSGATGTGNGTVAYSVAANTGAARNGTITAANLTFNISQAAGAAAPENVIWTNVVNCAVSGNSLQKTGGCEGCTDAGAWSQQSITSGNGYLEFTATETNKIRFGALTATRSTTNYTLLDFSLQFNSSGYAEVRENFVYKTDTPFASGNVFRIAVESGVVKYYKNGTVFYTSTKAPTFPLYADAVMTNLNSTITNAVILPSSGPLNVTWTNVVNCTVTGNSLQKTGGCDGCSDAGAWSQQSISSGNGYLEFTATETNKMRFGALTATRSATNSALLDFAIQFNGGGYAEVRENGAYKTDTPVASGNVFRIAVESGVVKYYKNGTVFYTSTKTPSFPLYADAVMSSLNGTITNAQMSGAQ